MKKVIKLTESDLMRIVKKVINEDLAHTQRLYTSWANKRSGNPEAAMKIMDDVLNYQKRLPKKDFANYSSYDELVADINKIKDSLKSDDATKIYEDSELVVLAPNTWEASCKYGAGSKWCTTAKDTSSYWERHNQTGTEFFWIFKNKPQSDPNYKFSYHIKMNGGADWCNAINTCTSNLSKNAYPLQHPKYNEIIAKLQEFHNNRDDVKKYLENRPKQDVIYDFVKKEFIKNLKEYIKIFNFENELDDDIFTTIETFDFEFAMEETLVDNKELIDEIDFDDVKEYVYIQIESINKKELIKKVVDGQEFIYGFIIMIRTKLYSKLNMEEPIKPQLDRINFNDIVEELNEEEVIELFKESSYNVIEDLIWDNLQNYLDTL